MPISGTGHFRIRWHFMRDIRYRTLQDKMAFHANIRYRTLRDQVAFHANIQVQDTSGSGVAFHVQCQVQDTLVRWHFMLIQTN